MSATDARGSGTTLTRRAAADGGPPLVLVAGVFVALFVASLVAGPTLGSGYPSPFQPTAQRLAYFADNARAVKATAVLQFAAAVPLAVFAAAVHARFQRLGVRVAGVTIGLAGGLLASALLMGSALVQWTLARPETLTDRAGVLVLQDLAFLTGGPGHVVPLGLLVAGIAVPALLLRLLPRAVAVVGVALAALAELSTLSLIWPAAAFLLPAARFPILLWLLVVAWQLPSSRRAAAGGDNQPGRGLQMSDSGGTR